MKSTENSIVAFTGSNCSTREISEQLGVSQSVVIRVQKRRSVVPKSQIRRRKKLLTNADARSMVTNIKRKLERNKSGKPLVDEWQVDLLKILAIHQHSKRKNLHFRPKI